MAWKPGWKSGGGLVGGRETIAEAARDQLGRVAITKRQREVVVQISRSIRERGYPPTMRELAESFGWSGPSAAQQQVRILERKGWIVRDRNRARAMRVVK